KRDEYSAIGFFEHHNFAYREKSNAHVALSKCLKYMSLSSDQELKLKASKMKNTLENKECKKDINAYWVSKKQKEKKQTIEKRIEIAERKSKLYDLRQFATLKKLVYKQDNTVRESFNEEMLEKRDSIQDIEKEPSNPKSRKQKAKNLPKNKMRLLEHQLESEDVDGENEEYEDEDDIIDFSTVLFDQQVESNKAIDQAKELQSEGKRLNASTLSTIRLGLSSIVDISSKFSGGMCTWFGKKWSELKAKALAQINIKPKKFEDAIESDINKIEELCNEYKYWEARDFVYEKLKGRPDKTRILQRQIMKIYFFILEMFLTDPFIFVDKKGNKQNLTEIEFMLKVAGPIIDIIFFD
ncbi:6903_t:CDS:2, partial [Gigaspora rosea]